MQSLLSVQTQHKTYLYVFSSRMVMMPHDKARLGKTMIKCRSNREGKGGMGRIGKAR